jgi:SnoaL-like protein
MDDISAWAGPAVPPSPEELADRYAIGELAKIYGLGLDMRNYEFCRSAFADEAIGIGRQGSQPIDDYLAATYETASSFHSTQHLMAQQYIRLDGDEAEVWTYGIAHHKRAPGETDDEIIAGVQYRDKCRRFPQGWLIVERNVFLQWMDMAPSRNTPRS